MNNQLAPLIVLLLILVAFILFFILVTIFSIKLSRRRGRKWPEEKLLKSYKNTDKKWQTTIAIVGFFLVGIFTFYLYFMVKKQHSIYENALIERNITFEKSA
ncbi:hypothetical protein [Listeria ilorinensis]|uniref:hypothetical protein n=1 Tax=Listeria ilorinensis TaxID=2867439 RepID=UPI001EF69FA4|nr:hypothetical protein [Listeria ilorinensis]